MDHNRLNGGMGSDSYGDYSGSLSNSGSVPSDDSANEAAGSNHDDYDPEDEEMDTVDKLGEED